MKMWKVYNNDDDNDANDNDNWQIAMIWKGHATLAFNSAYLKEINYEYYMKTTFFVVSFNQTLGCLRKTPSSVGVLRR